MVQNRYSFKELQRIANNKDKVTLRLFIFICHLILNNQFSFPDHLILPITFKINSHFHKPKQGLALSILVILLHSKNTLNGSFGHLQLLLFCSVLTGDIVIVFRKPDVRFLKSKWMKNKTQHLGKSEFMFLDKWVLF